MLTAIEHWVRRLSYGMALSGGAVLLVLVVVTVVSVSGRALISAGLGPLPGDFELVEAGMAFAVFAFLPWCHLNKGNAEVELFTMRFSQTANRLIDLTADMLMLVFACAIGWQHLLGTLDKHSNGETTFILQFPLWWAYAASLAGAAALLIVAIFCVMRSMVALGAAIHSAGGRP